MKRRVIGLSNNGPYREEFVMCRRKHITKLSQEYTWIGNEESEEYVDFPISVEVVVARYHHNGSEYTEMSIVRIQNGVENVIFESEDLDDYGGFKKAVEDLEKKGFQRVYDCDYVE